MAGDARCWWSRTRAACAGRSRVLRQGGYRVLEASAGAEALTLFERHGSDIELVVTDVVMPRMSGRALTSEVLQRKPNQRILYISGYADDVLGATVVAQPQLSFLPKPFSAADLLAKVRASLDEATPGRTLQPSQASWQGAGEPER
jgi:two-component system, cell cycle sensor histidine kinase and response regulator CckA